MKEGITMKRIFAIALAVLMVVTMVPFSVFAADCNHIVEGGTLSKVNESPATCTEKFTYEHYKCNECNKLFIATMNAVTEVTLSSLQSGSSLGHSAAKVDKVDATCTVNGTIEYWHCSRCNKNFKDSTCLVEATDLTIPAAHKYVDKAGKDANCTEAGYSPYKECSACHDMVGKTTVNAKGHEKGDKIAGQAATCTTAGWNEDGFKCKNCSANFKDPTPIPATGHTPKKVAATAATCVKEGNSEHWVCLDCNKTYKEEACTTPVNPVIDKIGHKFSTNFKIDKEATCKEAGSKSKPCSVCGEKSEVTPIAKLDHVWKTEKDVDKVATCTAEGQKSIHCKNCDTIKDGTIEKIAKLEHQEVEDVVKAPTCTAKGKSIFTCNLCKATRTVETDALGHKDKATVIEPTCTTDGYTNHTCEVCNTFLEVSDKVEAFGHDCKNYVSNNDATCQKDGTMSAACENGCGYKETKTDEGSMIPHEMTGDSVVVKQPTCTEEGEREVKCFNCDYIEGESIDALGHDAESQGFTIDKAATCTVAGSKSKHCTRCDYVQDVTEIPAIGHNYAVDPSSTAATCVTGGKITYTCANCADSYTEDDGPALGHAFITYTRNGDATCSKNETESSKCERCDVIDTREVPETMLPHAFGGEVVKAKATPTKDGSKEATCTECGHVEVTKIGKVNSFKLAATTYTYDGKVKTPKLTVKDADGNTLKKNVDYKVKVPSGRKKTGTYTYKVTFIGDEYSGTKSVSYKIVPTKTKKLTQSETTETSFKLTWDKVSGATGYRIYVMNKKTGKYSILVKSTKKLSYTVKGLKKGSNNMYAVKAYKKIGDTTYWATTYAEIKGQTLIGKTSSLKATAAKTSVKLSWKAVEGADLYKIYVLNPSTGKYKTLGSTTKKTYTAKNLKKGTKYTFAVKAFTKINGKNVASKTFTTVTKSTTK